VYIALLASSGRDIAARSISIKDDCACVRYFVLPTADLGGERMNRGGTDAPATNFSYGAKMGFISRFGHTITERLFARCSRLLPVSTFLQVRWGVLVELGAYSGPWPVCRDITRLANHISHSHRLLGRYSTLPSWGFSLPPEKTCIRRAQWLTAPVEPIC
jgi:hypothetical protein